MRFSFIFDLLKILKVWFYIFYKKSEYNYIKFVLFWWFNSRKYRVKIFSHYFEKALALFIISRGFQITIFLLIKLFSSPPSVKSYCFSDSLLFFFVTPLYGGNDVMQQYTVMASGYQSRCKAICPHLISSTCSQKGLD